MRKMVYTCDSCQKNDDNIGDGVMRNMTYAQRLYDLCTECGNRMLGLMRLAGRGEPTNQPKKVD